MLILVPALRLVLVFMVRPREGQSLRVPSLVPALSLVLLFTSSATLRGVDDFHVGGHD
jgi:hypothetical protein